MGDQLRFGIKTADELRLVGIVGLNDLEGHFSIYKGLPGAVNHAVGTLADGFLNFVAFDCRFILDDQMPLHYGDK